VLYHWITAVIGIALFLWVWAWSQAWANDKECEGMMEEAPCGMGADCHSCMRETHAKIDSRDGKDSQVYLEVNDQIDSRS
jgi:hypothetical protein